MQEKHVIKTEHLTHNKALSKLEIDRNSINLTNKDFS